MSEQDAENFAPDAPQAQDNFLPNDVTDALNAPPDTTGSDDIKNELDAVQYGNDSPDSIYQRLAELEAIVEDLSQRIIIPPILNPIFPATNNSDSTYSELYPLNGTLSSYATPRTNFSGLTLTPTQVICVEMRDADNQNMRYIPISNGTGSATLIRVTLATDGGSAGDDTTQCSFTYTVTDPSTAITLATTVTPETQRPNLGELTAAIVGIWDKLSSQLTVAIEPPVVVACS